MPNDRQELERLRKERRLAELEAKASGAQQVSMGGGQGANASEQERQERASLARVGASTLDAWGVGGPGPVLAAPAATFSDRVDSGGGEVFERVGAASIGSLDLPSFSYSDELAGVAFGPEAKNRARSNIEAAWEHHPASTFAGGAHSLLVPGQGIRGANTGQKILSGSTRGGAFGAVYGHGSGEGGALSPDRLFNTAKTGATSAVLGGGFVLGGRGLEFGGRRILGSAEARAAASYLFGRGTDAGTIKLVDRAIGEVQRASAVGGEKIDRVVAKQRLTEALGKAEMEDMLGDLVPGGVTSMEGSALPGMEGADIVVSSLRNRGEGQYKRINSAVAGLVDGQDIESSLANLAQIKEEEASPLYREAFSSDKQVDPNHPRFRELTSLLRLDDFKLGIAAGEDLLKIEKRNPDAKFNQLNPFEQIDWIKKGLDSEIGKLLRAGDDQKARALINAKNSMLEIADDMNGTYREARQVWSGAESQKNALLLGESLFNNSGQVKTGESLREIRRQYDGFSEAEKTAFSIGLFEKAMSSVGTVVETGTANSAKRGFLSPNSERALRDFLPQEQADEFLSLMQREYRQQMNANQALGGSPTGRRINAGEAVRMATGGARAAAAEIADPKGLIGRAQDKIRQTIGNNPNVQRRFAEFLTQDANNPAMRRALGIDSTPSSPPGGSAPNQPANAFSAASPGPSQAAPVENAFKPVTGGVVGGMAGGAMAQDLDGDGEVSMQERYLQAAGGAALVAGGAKVAPRIDDAITSPATRNLLDGGASPNGMGGGARRRNTSNEIRNNLRVIDGGPNTPQPRNAFDPAMREVIDATTPIRGPVPSDPSKVTGAQARGQLRDDLIRAGDDPQQVERVLELLGDDAVNVLTDRQVGPAFSRGNQAPVGDGGAGLIGITAVGGAGALYMAIENYKRHKNYAPSKKLNAAELVEAIEGDYRRSNGLPPTPSRKPEIQNAFQTQ